MLSRQSLHKLSFRVLFDFIQFHGQTDETRIAVLNEAFQAALIRATLRQGIDDCILSGADISEAIAFKESLHDIGKTGDASEETTLIANLIRQYRNRRPLWERIFN